MPSRRVSLLKSSQVGQLLTYAGAGAVAGLAILAAIYPERAMFNEKRPDITRPNEWPIIGSLPEMLRAQTKIYDWILTNFEEYGLTCTVTALFVPRNIMTADPRNVEHILKNNFDNYTKGPVFHEKMDPLFGHGIFNADGPEWRYQRKTASHIFKIKNFRDHFTAVFVEELIYMKDALFDTAADAGTEIDFHDILFKYTLDSFVRIGFGTELGALKQKEKLPFAIAFDAAQTQIAQRHIFPFWQTAELANRIFRPWRSTMDDYVKVVNNFAHEVVEQRRNDPDKEKRSDLLSRFMNTRDENGNILNDTQLRDIVLNFIIAGRDTTAQAISWTFYELARHPEIEEKLLAEVLDSINEDMTPNQLYEAIKEMKYAHAVFYEVLRHYPSVPVNQKYALTDDVWPDGTHIKAGDYVMWCPHAQGRLEAVWGADAKEFRPERWLIDGSLRKVSQGEWPAFHGGPRVCLGQNLATLETLVTLSLLLKRYHFTLIPGQNITYMNSLTLPMKEGLRMYVEKRGL